MILRANFSKHSFFNSLLVRFFFYTSADSVGFQYLFTCPFKGHVMFPARRSALLFRPAGLDGYSSTKPASLLLKSRPRSRLCRNSTLNQQPCSTKRSTSRRSSV